MDMRLRSAPSPEQWMKYEQAPMAKQRKVLQEYEDELQDVSIKDPDGIQAGDHVVCKRSFMFGSIKYYHHMLCIGRSGDDVEVIEYNGPNKLRISPASKCLFFKDLGLKGKVMKQVYSVQDFMKKKVRRILIIRTKCWKTKNDVETYVLQMIAKTELKFLADITRQNREAWELWCVFEV